MNTARMARLMELETTCKRCGGQFTPSHDDYIKGVWRVCPLYRKATPKTKGA